MSKGGVLSGLDDPFAASSVSSVIYKAILLCQVSSDAVHFSLNGRCCFTFPFIALLLPLYKCCRCYM
jgi:hypothetical protein